MRMLLCLFLLAGSFPALAEPPNVASFGTGDMPVGVLGKRLGTRTVISGEQGKPVMLANPLAVTTVDGVALPHPVWIEIREGAQIKRGVRYELEGYEAGEFSGPPTWTNSQAQQPFQYRPFFIVTRVIAPASSPSPTPAQ